VKRLRLNRAAGYLADTDMPIETVASRSGDPNVQSFTRIFKDVYGLPPATYRERGSHTQFDHCYDARTQSMYDVTINTIAPMSGVSIVHTGPYMERSRAFEQFFGGLARGC
jgi:AraC family transcriptional regulator